MTLYAVEAIDDAIEATKSFLWPFDRGRWLRLAVIVFFIGGSGGYTPFQFSGSAPTGSPSDSPFPPGTPSPEVVVPGGLELLVIAVIVGLIVSILLGLLFVGSVMEFVFVESLRRETVSVRRYWSDHWRLGVRLFGFRLLLGVLTLGIFAALVAVVLSPILYGNEGLVVGLALFSIPIFLVVGLSSGLIGGFTTNFIVPIMIAEDRPLLSSWRRFWPTLTGQWKQYAAYLIFSFIIQIAVGILTSVAIIVALVVAAVPFGIVGLVGVALLSVAEIVGGVLIAVAALLFVVSIFVVALFVAVPLQTYSRYFALFVLGDTEAEFDLIAERRARIRE
ncbi:DUF7544 domain-containing protein [Halorubrum sp. HHNYT27]|uniref:DUF7544 domain-containing protein n=1 Tax=Halorubrum sp. HHNYT27 TaxID=3402275 RepID=UPI003EBCF5A8